MIHTQNMATKIFVQANQITNAATASGLIDTLDYDYATLEVYVSTADDPTSNLGKLILSEATASNGSFTTVATGDTDFTIASGDTSVPQVVARINLPLVARERWLKLEINPTTTQDICAVGFLTRKTETPTGTNVGAAVVHNV